MLLKVGIAKYKIKAKYSCARHYFQVSNGLGALGTKEGSLIHKSLQSMISI